MVLFELYLLTFTRNQIYELSSQVIFANYFLFFSQLVWSNFHQNRRLLRLLGYLYLVINCYDYFHDLFFYYSYLYLFHGLSCFSLNYLVGLWAAHSSQSCRDGDAPVYWFLIMMLGLYWQLEFYDGVLLLVKQCLYFCQSDCVKDKKNDRFVKLSWILICERF